MKRLRQKIFPMKKNSQNLYLTALLTLSFMGCTNQANERKDYPITPVPFTQVQLHDNFWLPRILKNTEVTIPIAFQQSEETGRIKNFEIAGGLKEGSFCSKYAFDDSDVFKIIEGASYSLMIKPDPELEAYLDSLIYKISLAQEDDGYLYTNRTIMGDSALEMAGKSRWVNESEHSHELYNAGHLYEAAVAHFQATGKKTLLDVAIKNANLIDKEFGWGKIEKYPGHQEIEIGLVKLYRATGEKKYLDLAKFFLDVRGPGGWEYNQAHLKVIDQKEPVGHAVRAMYMFSGMADVAALTGDTAYLHAIDRIWENVVNKKMYITGGIGQTGGNEGFGPDYDIPNMSAYCETCASIAEVFLNHRLFLLHGDSKYIDIMERVMYNALLSGVSLTGDLFFYDNPLESAGQHARQAWFGCACCPSNISRFLPSVPGYVYAHEGDDIYVNLFIESEASFETPKGKFTLTQKGNYPWEEECVIHVYPEYARNRTIYIRIPGWARNEAVPGDLYRFEDRFDKSVEIRINGEEIKYEIERGYALLDRKWQHGDSIEISLPLPVRKVIANEKVAEDRNKFILQRGPLVYCAEGIDQEENSVLHIFADKNQEFKTGIADFGGEITNIEFSSTNVRRILDGSLKADNQSRVIKAIPYCYWANRGPGEMMTWIPCEKEAANLLPAPTIANLSKKSSSGAKEDLNLISDQYDPKNSNDHSRGYIHWWPQKDTTVWVQYDFQKPETASECSVYWFDDGPDGGCRIPEGWRILYRQGSHWEAVNPMADYKTTKDGWDKINFKPLKTSGLRLEIQLQKEYSSGVHEWVVK
jgi:uncharacterized protein